MISSRNLVEVGISMVLQDQFSAKSQQIADSFSSMMYQIRTASSAAYSTFQPVLDMGTGILKGFNTTFQEFAEVNNEMFLVGKMSQASAAQVENLTKYIRDINLEVPLTASDLSSAARYLAMAGNSAEDIQNLIRPVAQLSSVLGIAAGGQGGTADMLTNIMKMFQLSTTTATSVADDLFSAVTNANISLNQLQDAIKYSGAEAHASGLSIQETAAAIALLGDIGIQGSSAGTALANSLRYLKQSVTGYKKGGLNALTQLGITPSDLVDAQGNLRSLTHIYRTFFKAATARGYGNVELSNLFNQIFGVRGNRNMLSVIAQLDDENNAYYKTLRAMGANEGILQQVTEERLDTPLGKVEQLRSAIDNLKQSIGESIAGPMTTVLNITTGIVKAVYSFSQTGVGGVLVKIVAIQIAVGVIVNSVRMIRMFFQVISVMAQNFSNASNGASNALARGNAMSSSMEMHLMKCLIYMERMQAISFMSMMPPGLTQSSARMGGRAITYGRDATSGLPFVSYVTKSGQRVVHRGQDAIHFGQRSAAYQTRSMIKAPAPKPTPTPPTTSPKFGFGKVLGRSLGMASMMLGGPWGLAIGALLTGITLWNSSTDRNTEAIDRNTKEQESERLQNLSAEEFRKEKELEQIRLLRGILTKLGEKDDKPIQVIINGRPINVNPGDQTDFSDLFNNFPTI